jgi:PilZ domain
MGGNSSVIQTSWSVLKRKDLRHHRRYLVDSGILQVSWLDITGKMKMTRTRALNISEGGIAIVLPEAAQPLSMVRFQSDKFKIRGAGTVRHCRREGSKFIVGLEFTEGLRWQPPEGDLQEPIPLCQPDSA